MVDMAETVLIRRIVVEVITQWCMTHEDTTQHTTDQWTTTRYVVTDGQLIEWRDGELAADVVKPTPFQAAGAITAEIERRAGQITPFESAHVVIYELTAETERVVIDFAVIERAAE